MKDFKSYAGDMPENNGAQNAQNSGNGASKGANDVNSTVELAKILTKAMSGKSESQILRTIISEAERGKRDGTLTNADLDNFYNALSPLLDGMKKRKLKEVIQRLKSI